MFLVLFFAFNTKNFILKRSKNFYSLLPNNQLAYYNENAMDKHILIILL